MRPLARRTRELSRQLLALPRGYRARPATLAPRALFVLCTVVAAALVPAPEPAFVPLLVLATIVSVPAPGRFGALVVLVVLVVFWTVGLGREADVSVVRTMAFAVVGYVLFESASLAATVPVDARLSRGVVTGWARGSWPGLASIVVAAAVVEVVRHPTGSPAIDVAGIFGALACVSGLVFLVRRPDSGSAADDE